MQKFLKIVFILFIVFIIYNTLIPFRIITDLQQVQKNLQNIQYIPYLNKGVGFSLTDIAGNILLFIPFGFLIFILLNNKNAFTKLFLSILFGFIFSLFIEISQLFFHGRTSSLLDLAMNTTGTFFGALAALVYLKIFSAKANKWLKYFLSHEKATLIVVLFIGAQVIGAAIPFNVTISVSDIKKSFKKTNITPFEYSPLGEKLGFKIKEKTKNENVFSCIEFWEDVLLYSIYGYFVFMSYFLYWKNQKRAILKLLFFLILIFPMIEFMQFFINSRISDLNDVLSAYFGVIFGGGILFIEKRNWFPEKSHLSFTDLRIPIILYIIFLFYTGLKPFQFSLETSVLAQDLKSEHMIPFFSYFKKTSVWNIYDIFETSIAF